MTISLFKKMLGMDGGLCDQVRLAAAELTQTAKELTQTVSSYDRAPDPFGALLTSVWNNHEFAKFSENLVDGPVGPRPISQRAIGSRE